MRKTTVISNFLNFRKNGMGGSNCTDSRRSLYNSKGSIFSSTVAGGDVNGWTTVENFTALHVAAHAGHADLVEMLLSKYQVGYIERVWLNNLIIKTSNKQPLF